MTPILKQDCSDSFNNAVPDTFFCAVRKSDFTSCEVSVYQNYSDCLEEKCHQQLSEIIMSLEEHQNKITPVIIGLSTANKNCYTTLPLVFLKISAYQDWIEKILNFFDEHHIFSN
jgi:DNA-binding transcriptional regulator GbsR (MarR family)